MRKTIKTIVMFALVLGSTKAIAQNAAINSSGSAPDASAMLDVSSTTKGLLTPRMTSAQRTSIASPATGLIVYQTDGTAGFYYYDGGSWVMLINSVADNSVTGAKIALGSDAQGDVMYYNGTDWARLAAGTNGQYLKTQGAGANPTWANVSATPTITRYTSTSGAVASGMRGVYIACTAGSVVGGGCQSDDIIYDDCPGTSSAACNSAAPTGWRCNAYTQGGGVTAYVICLQ